MELPLPGGVNPAVAAGATAVAAAVLRDGDGQGHRLRRGRRVHHQHDGQRRGGARQVQPSADLGGPRVRRRQSRHRLRAKLAKVRRRRCCGLCSADRHRARRRRHHRVCRVGKPGLRHLPGIRRRFYTHARRHHLGCVASLLADCGVCARCGGWPRLLRVRQVCAAPSEPGWHVRLRDHRYARGGRRRLRRQSRVRRVHGGL